jgi:hypothetical protein
MTNFQLTSLTAPQRQTVENWLGDGTDENAARAALSGLADGTRPATSTELTAPFLDPATDEPTIGRIMAAWEILQAEDGPRALVHPLLDPASDPASYQRAVAGLRRLNTPSALELLTTRSLEANEPSEPMRTRAALALIKIGPHDLADRLLRARAQAESYPWERWVRLLALKVLVASRREPAAMLIESIQSESWSERLAGCAVLRQNAEIAPPLHFPPAVEKDLARALAARLEDAAERAEVQSQAALAVGDLEMSDSPHRSAALQSVRRALEESADYQVRRSCVDTLARVNGPETQPALILALRDARNAKAEIRSRALDALNRSLQMAGAIGLLVEQAVPENNPPAEAGLVEALRQLDRAAVARQLQVKLLDSDPAVRARAARALAEVGPDAVYDSYLKQRLELIKADSSSLSDASTKITNNYETIVAQTKESVTFVRWLHGLLFGGAVVGVVMGLGVAVYASAAFSQYVGIGTAVAGHATLLFLVYFNPVRISRRSSSLLVKAGLLSMNQLRQISQAEALYRYALSSPDLAPEQAVEMARALQSSLQGTLEALDSSLRG